MQKAAGAYFRMPETTYASAGKAERSKICRSPYCQPPHHLSPDRYLVDDITGQLQFSTFTVKEPAGNLHQLQPVMKFSENRLCPILPSVSQTEIPYHQLKVELILQFCKFKQKILTNYNNLCAFLTWNCCETEYLSFLGFIGWSLSFFCYICPCNLWGLRHANENASAFSCSRNFDNFATQ